MQEEEQSHRRKYREDAMPAIVNAMLIFFYLVVWGDLIGLTVFTTAANPGSVVRYLPPLVLYAALLVGFPALNWRRFRSGEGKVSDLLWGYYDQLAHTIIYISVNFGVVIWLSALKSDFANLYFVLLSVSAGLLSRRWKIMWPVIALEFAAFMVQSGMWDVWRRSGFDLFNEQVAGFAAGMALFMAYVVMVSILIASRVKSEALVNELRAARARLEDALLTERELGVLRERNRMAREMHDLLGHALVLVAVKIEAAQRLQSVDPERAAAELEATKDLVRQSMADLRASLAEMRSPDFGSSSAGFTGDAHWVLGDGEMNNTQHPTANSFGAHLSLAKLTEALHEWATRTAGAVQGTLSIQCDLDSHADDLQAPVQDALWKVGREAVLNVVKHARAKNVQLDLFLKDGQAVLRVTDDGVGIPHLAEGGARLEVQGHYGIRGMRERVEALGGHLAIEPGRRGKGTSVMATVPVLQGRTTNDERPKPKPGWPSFVLRAWPASGRGVRWPRR